jgi:hypothetical protein
MQQQNDWPGRRTSLSIKNAKAIDFNRAKRGPRYRAPYSKQQTVDAPFAGGRRGSLHGRGRLDCKALRFPKMWMRHMACRL